MKIIFEKKVPLIGLSNRQKLPISLGKEPFMKIIIILALITLTGCSFSDSTKEKVTTNPDDLEFAVDTIADAPAVTDLKVEEQPIATTEIHDEAAPVSSTVDEDIKKLEITATDIAEPRFEDFKPSKETAKIEAPAETYKEEVRSPVISKIKPSDVFKRQENYRVQKGDTLMMIAFKIYGDYRKWKDIKELNRDKLKSKLSDDMELKYFVVDESFSWKPEGTPYLVKTGDTLQKISMDSYGTTRKWKFIYENNRPLIKDPNLIFAGFTLYYKPSRDLASRPR